MHSFHRLSKQYDEKALAARLLLLYAKRNPFSRYMTKIYNFL
ncbi:hypothetical protein CBR59_21690 [Bacillus thuringiensis]|uniref:Uncharacterized protein n=5 Tax=Bacillus cereus group TaxID=86661 RepID=A0A9X7GGR6_BACTU|nr:hypothetical protein CAB88_11975 [Bacillus thuringiensis]ASZ69245.1 hypothetical protein CJ306_12930 [Bacillus cereus]OTW39951.1 hypothetical protein BK698_18985 [Bacillus thuringiensis serovar thuringiensis]OTY08393.1 hypothetical protein BK734_16455 [Bacillus thuringiensis serovar kim]OTY64943.1 hypothetical protein BK753_24350 [Bacillus thuringiensis serovar canadensis]OTY84892.1 hypothetical protein BK754_28575 [Bacillus thuringiensis serovar subtoxicus]OTZ36090.1 hypothetical protein 